jgi:hypothetical protein
MRTTLILLTAVAAAASTQATAAAPPHHHLPPPSDFVAHVDNPWFPLTPGTVLTSKGESDGTPITDVFTVTHQMKTIKGVRATVINDRVLTHGRVTERTSDWYAQDKAGNVWYLGERTATYKTDGTVESREGSWQAGVDGAVAGIAMPAHPGPPYASRMELARGQAEDMSWVVQRLPSAPTPGRRYHDIVRTLEWTRLEPGVVSMKLYARGLGIVMEKDLAGGDERFWLVSSSVS